LMMGRPKKKQNSFICKECSKEFFRPSYIKNKK